jgi:hypothetical protein
VKEAVDLISAHGHNIHLWLTFWFKF